MKNVSGNSGSSKQPLTKIPDESVEGRPVYCRNCGEELHIIETDIGTAAISCNCRILPIKSLITEEDWRETWTPLSKEEIVRQEK